MLISPWTRKSFERKSLKNFRDVAIAPGGEYHFHTGRPLAARLEYEAAVVDDLPYAAVESFAGIAYPFSLRRLTEGERVTDAGSGAGFDCFIAAGQVRAKGRVVGIDMTEEVLEKLRATARELWLDNTEFREGLLEDMPVADS